MATITIDGKELEFVANAATPIRFKQIFKKDLMKQFQNAEDEGAYDAVAELAFIMNVQAEKNGFAGKTFDDFCDWLEGFSPMAFMNVAEELVSVWTDSEDTNSTPKK